MLKETLKVWLFKGLEIILAYVVGYLVYALVLINFSDTIAIPTGFVVGYFFGSIIKPYIDTIREYLYNTILKWFKK